MSFEPELIIKREALEKAQTTNFGFDWDYEKLKEEDYEVYEFLNKAYYYGGYFTFQNIKMIILRPEFTGFNERVRNKLTELGIEFALTN